MKQTNVLTLFRRASQKASLAYLECQRALGADDADEAAKYTAHARFLAVSALAEIAEACEIQGWSGEENIPQKKSLNRARVVVPPDHVIERLHRRALEAVEGPIFEETFFRLMLDAWGEGAHYTADTNESEGDEES